jgi:hypothetical protein
MAQNISFDYPRTGIVKPKNNQPKRLKSEDSGYLCNPFMAKQEEKQLND